MLTLNTERLYRVQRKDLPALRDLLTICFREDPLYQKLIPDPDVRKRLMPELFRSDSLEYFRECDIFADSEELNSIIMVIDESEHYSLVSYYLTELLAWIRTDACLIKEDWSLKTFHNFMKGKEYLNSRWTQDLKDEQRLHIEYLAARPSMQHHGLSGHLLNEVLSYADEHHLMVSLETHNEKNLVFYKHHGFELFDVVNRELGLNQYCLIRPRREDGKTTESVSIEQHNKMKDA